MRVSHSGHTWSPRPLLIMIILGKVMYAASSSLTSRILGTTPEEHAYNSAASVNNDIIVKYPGHGYADDTSSEVAPSFTETARNGSGEDITVNRTLRTGAEEGDLKENATWYNQEFKDLQRREQGKGVFLQSGHAGPDSKATPEVISQDDRRAYRAAVGDSVNVIHESRDGDMEDERYTSLLVLDAVQNAVFKALLPAEGADSTENNSDSSADAPRDLSSPANTQHAAPLTSLSSALTFLPLDAESTQAYADASRSLTAPSTSSSCYSTTSTTFCGSYAYTYSTRYSYTYSYTYSVKYSYTYSYSYSYTYATTYAYTYSYSYGYTYSYTYAYTSYYTYSYTCSYTYSYRYSYTYSYTYYYTCSYRYSYSCSCGKGCTRTCYGTRYSTCSGTGYGTAYATGYGTRYYTCYGRRYYTAYATGYGTRYATGYGTAYATKYSTGYATGYRTGYATKYVTAYATAYATKYSTAYATATCSVCYCAGGYYSPYGIAAATGTCSSCPSGQYSSGNGNTGCTSCSGGKYQDSSAQTSCKTCPAVSTLQLNFY